MKGLDTREYIEYCRLNWFTKKQTKMFLKLLKEIIKTAVATEWKFVLHWLWTFRLEDFKSNLKWWNTYRKIKFIPSDTFKNIIPRKW